MQYSSLISAEEALQLYQQSKIKFVDASWYLPNDPADVKQDYRDVHLPGAVHFDIDEIADASCDLPHMFPSLEKFEECVGSLGLSDHDHLVIYDRSAFIASARAWWMFRSFGHAKAQVLNGGLSAWQKAGEPVESSVVKTKACSYRGKPMSKTVADWAEMVSNIHERNFVVLDARSPSRFNGQEPEPRPGLRAGHIPNSQNFYYKDLIDENGIMLDSRQIAGLLDKFDLKSGQDVVTTCGSGVTAAILLLAMHQVHHGSMRLYDGSWTEWALHPDSPR